ncbi:hypothetical protein FS837_000952 [Tulasnella sp. UAMH 9824]|nr:hypothetical protein FS837_000952 [Tulasnella sp. UAMH 9824]
MPVVIPTVPLHKRSAYNLGYEALLPLSFSLDLLERFGVLNHPYQEVPIFSTTADNQPTVTILSSTVNVPYQSPRQVRPQRHPTGSSRVPQIEVSFDIDANSNLKVGAFENGKSESTIFLPFRNVDGTL